MKLFFLSFLILFSPAVIAQKENYLKMRDHLVVHTCGGTLDSAVVFETIRRLEAVDTFKVKKNINKYYEDLGTYYWLAGTLNDVYLHKAILALKSALYHDPHSRKALWDLAFVYGFLHDCEKAKLFFAEYHRHTPREHESGDSSQQEMQLLAECESKN